MFKRKLILFSIFILSLVLLGSCSDSSSEPNNKKDEILSFNTYFPTTIGSWWVYENYKIDDEGAKVESTVKIDSTVLIGKELKEGILADIYKTYDNIGNEYSVQHYYREDTTKLYTHSDYINFLVNQSIGALPVALPFTIKSMWMKIADFNLSSWKVYDTTFTNFELYQGLTINGNFTVNCKKGIQSYINTAQAGMIKSQEFIMTLQFKGYISVDSQNERTFTITIHNWYGENAGLLKCTVDNTVFEYGLGSYNFQGNESKILKFNIKE